MFLKAKTITIAALLALAMSSASATVMDFTGMSNYANFSQNGLNMTANSVWNWPGANMAHMDYGTAVFKLASNQDFNLDSVQMISSGGSGLARFTAWDNGVLLNTVDVGGLAGLFQFNGLFSGIDEFRISYVNDHFTFDNINFSNAVPLPGVLSLLGLSLAGLAVFSRKRT